jgi:hypothetical protein
VLISPTVSDAALRVRNFPDFERWSHAMQDVGRCIVIAPRALDPRGHGDVASVVLDVEEGEWAWSDHGGADIVEQLTSGLRQLGRASEVLTTRTHRNDGTPSRDILVICAAFGEPRHAEDVTTLYAALAGPVNELRAARTFESPNRIAADCRRRLAELLARTAGDDYANRITQSEEGFQFVVDRLEPISTAGFVRCALRHPTNETTWAEFAVRSTGHFKHCILVRSHGLGIDSDHRKPKGWPV